MNSQETILPAAPRWKRGLDGLCILIAFPILAPVSVVIVLWIKLVSRGPVFFVQERVGFQGRRFHCYKFRSMVVNSDSSAHERHLAHLLEAGAPMKKMDEWGDARVIRLGSLFRASGLDELPQLINVLRGEMSIVGPRPCLPYEYEKYQARHKKRCEALPGITGLWQVTGKNTTTFEEMVTLDVDYIRKMSLGLDLKILFKTVAVIASQVKETIARKFRAGRVQASLEAGMSSERHRH